MGITAIGAESSLGIWCGVCAMAWIIPLYLWLIQRQKTRKCIDSYSYVSEKLKLAIKAANEASARNAELEAEIIRLQKISLTPEAKRVDNSTIKAISPAHVRHLTEAAFGLQPQIGETVED